MFMKIFTMIIISFNNIFTIPWNINNDKTTTESIIRKKDKIIKFTKKKLNLTI
ncbi:hypothetical protein [Spiroplasma endosymbiont of Agriotes lineatus]|uniref:hypothetical protein n=1 Tax=Spiroplasma endosymbiont of Agriotes lineatus TaxID=3077930 RepID=UPI0030CE6B53